MVKNISIVTIITLFSVHLTIAQNHNHIGQTEITKWQYGKRTAISLTYDDNTINQFRVAMPLMDKLGFPGTFYVITGSIPGSAYSPEFIGRPVKNIIAETANVPTNESNFFERVSAVRFLGFKNTYKFHRQAGQLFEDGEKQKAYQLINSVYREVRNREFPPSNDSVEVRKAMVNVRHSFEGVNVVTWDQLKKYQNHGHEIGSHTISHPYLAGLDSLNLAYELKNSKKELRQHLGRKATFSAECPFGIEDDRVINYALNIYPCLRNRMPDPYIYEINRGSPQSPSNSDREYVEWKRGALSSTPMKTMKSWVDTTLKGNNIWLVLVFHGVNGIGWEPLTKNKLQEYFIYLKNNEDNIWVATFKDVTKYIRERENANININKQENYINLNVSHTLKDKRYNLPLTLKTYVPSTWLKVHIRQGYRKQNAPVLADEGGHYIIYQVIPNREEVTLSKN